VILIRFRIFFLLGSGSTIHNYLWKKSVRICNFLSQINIFIFLNINYMDHQYQNEFKDFAVETAMSHKKCNNDEIGRHFLLSRSVLRILIPIMVRSKTRPYPQHWMNTYKYINSILLFSVFVNRYLMLIIEEITYLVTMLHGSKIENVIQIQ
jgi:hypothetical protein